MKKLFLFKESDLKEMIKNLTAQWLHDESIILAIAINFFETLMENPEKYGITDYEHVGSDGNLIQWICRHKLVVDGKLVDIEIKTLDKNNVDYCEHWGKDHIRFFGEEYVAEKMLRRLRLFVYNCGIEELREIAKKFSYPHFAGPMAYLGEFGTSERKNEYVVV